jgi:hypothetical protein
MNRFVKQATDYATTTTTDNGMKAYTTTYNSCVDLFFAIGASRGKDIIPAFTRAYAEDKRMATRIALWARDIRGGAGERKLYRDILEFLSTNDPSQARKLLKITAEVGRWDDILSEKLLTSPIGNDIIALVSTVLDQRTAGCVLLAKWMPRKGKTASILSKGMGLTAKQYRKLLVGLTNVVETDMCSKNWKGIVYPHVPSKAMKNYAEAFKRNDGTRFESYVQSLVKGTEKINAKTLYPYEIISNIRDKRVAQAQWDALPNYIGNSPVLTMVDTSGSMETGSASVRPIDVAVSLGLYTATKNTGVFANLFLTFSGEPEFVSINPHDSIDMQVSKIRTAHWGMNTNIRRALELILSTAIKGDVPNHEMPKTLVIVSDMQFDGCCEGASETAFDFMSRRFADSGYSLPNIIFWNVNHRDNVPVRFNQQGVALVSGFSPAIFNSILKNPEDINPIAVMKSTVNVDRYDYEQYNS